MATEAIMVSTLDDVWGGTKPSNFFCLLVEMNMTHVILMPWKENPIAAVGPPSGYHFGVQKLGSEKQYPLASTLSKT